MPEYCVKVTSVTTIRVIRNTPDEAVSEACQIAWQYDADEIEGEIIEEECK